MRTAGWQSVGTCNVCRFWLDLCKQSGKQSAMNRSACYLEPGASLAHNWAMIPKELALLQGKAVDYLELISGEVAGQMMAKKHPQKQVSID